MATSRVPDVVNAAVDTLKGDTAFMALVSGVYTHVPQGTDPPYAMVIGGDEIPWDITLAFGDDSGDNGARQVDVTVQCVSTYRGSLQVDAIAARVMEVLTTAVSWAGVTGFALAEFLRNAAQPPLDLNGDGVLWFVRLVTIRVSLT